MEELKIDEKIDLRGVLCPTNFVKTKLKLEEMQSGQILELYLMMVNQSEMFRAV